MTNKSDWEELEEWDEKRKKDEIEKYGLNISNININKMNKIMNRILKVMKSFKVIAILLLIFLVILIISMISTYFGNFSFKMADYEVEKYILEKYNLDVTIFHKKREPNKNYILFEMYTNDSENIEFTVIKKYNKFTDDYITRRHKYYFNMWESSNESHFKIKEKEENGLLTNYETYLEGNLENTNDINDFYNFCGDNFMREWEIYVYKYNRKIYLLR